MCDFISSYGNTDCRNLRRLRNGTVDNCDLVYAISLIVFLIITNDTL